MHTSSFIRCCSHLSVGLRSRLVLVLSQVLSASCLHTRPSGIETSRVWDTTEARRLTHSTFAVSGRFVHKNKIESLTNRISHIFLRQTRYKQYIMCSPTMESTIPTREDFMILMRALVKPQKKRVRFTPFVTTSCAGPLPFEEVKELWYEQSELAAFKHQARSIVRSIRTHGVPKNGFDCDLLRGLEHCTAERQKHRYMTIRCTLSAYRKDMSPEKTAMVARKCTAWSEEIAFVQARHDYCNVYQPSMTLLIPATGLPPTFPFVMKKRVVADAVVSERRVRRRIVVQ
jgi:hypothetical protein